MGEKGGRIDGCGRGGKEEFSRVLEQVELGEKRVEEGRRK